MTFITNYPELNWAFNDPNDTLNAVSMFFVQVFGFSVDTPGVSEKIWNEFREGRISVSAYEATMVIPTSSDKDCPVNFNNEHRTAEFRIFDMPESLTQHMLHVEVAQKIFDHVARITDSGGVVPLEIDTNFFYELDRQSDMKDPKQYHKSWSLSKKRFRNVMKMLEIDPKRCRTQLRNIDTRFIWHSQTSDKCYLR